MKYYIEVTLIPDLENNIYFLWEKIYPQLHLQLVAGKNKAGSSDIGFSFPEYHAKFLGKKIRLFAQEKSQLEAFSINDCLAKFNDYVHIKSIQAVPEEITHYANFYRLQVKSNAERLMRRSVKNGKCTPEEVGLKLETLTDKETNLPYIKLKSQTNGESFKLFIDCYKQPSEKNQQIDQYQSFNCYGLSKHATVPIF